MVHYLDMRGGWDLKECECCFDRAVSLGAERVVTMESLEFVRSLLTKQVPDAAPLVPRQGWGNEFGCTRSVLDCALRAQAFGEQGEMEPRAQFSCKCALAPFVCAEAMLLEWMAEPRVGVLMDLGGIRSRLPAILANEGSVGDSPAAPAAAATWSCCCSSCWTAYRSAVSFAAFLVLVARWPQMDTIWKAHVDVYDAVYPALASQLGAGRQEEEDSAASVLVQVLGLKESADLKEGFGFFVQHVLSGGLEKAHAEGRGKGGAQGKTGEKAKGKGLGGAEKKGPMSAGLMGQMGQMGKVEQAMAAVMQSMQSGACVGPDDWLQIMHEHGVDMADMVAMLRGDGGGSMGMGLPFGIGGGGRGGSRKEGVGGGDLKGEKWRENLKGRVWERPEHRKLGAMFFAVSQSAASSNVHDAAIEEARERLGKRKLTSGKLGKEGNEGGATGGAVDATAAAAPAKGRPAPSVGNSGTSTIGSIGMLSPVLVPVNTEPTIGLLTYRVACILQWLRIFGSDFMSAKNCFKNIPHSKILPMRHPLRDLPSLLVRFGAVLPPLDGSTCLLDWEEWPEGDEAAMRFPEDSSARCFGLGRADGSRTNSGTREVQQGSFPEALLPHQSGESCSIVRCRADADLIVEFAGLFLEVPACAHCSQCITLYISHAPFIALIANFAYRPASVLLDRFLSVFKPRSEVFQSLLSRLGLDSSLNAPHSTQSDSCSSSSSSIHALRERAEQVPVAFLLSLALLCATPLLQQSGTEGGQNPRAGMGTSGAKEKAGGRRAASGASGEGKRGGKGGNGEEDSGVVWEEVQSWFTVAMLPPSGMGGGGLACSGRMEDVGEEDVLARVEEASEVYQCSLLPRFREDMKQGDGLGGFSKRKGKMGEEAAYLKAWPGGVNLVACLREMLLGEPCYRPASPAVSSTPAVPTTGAARTNAAVPVSVTEASGAAACRKRVCGAVGCGKVDGDGVKLRNCSGCGKVAFEALNARNQASVIR
ncbi:unnamed protein product [Closterium sp. Naga37s-1]|nr:unnamed protein product [Closterium sp. Naga37s-1]